MLVQKEPKVYGTIQKSDMQGPCPDGFHIPNKDEWQSVYNVGVSLGIWSSSSGDNMKVYLKLPYAGYIRYSDGYKTNSGYYGHYWSVSPYSTNSAYYLNIGADNIGPQWSWYRASGYSIRPFKDISVTPDGSWTSLYSDKIYHNSTLGLISLSSDGNTRITIADKNLGATTVYNNGDTLTQNNCGKFFQRGNNYDFNWSDASQTSTTQVNASGYGPGNYYSDRFFRKGYYDRSSVQNDNLWGGVSEGTYDVHKQIRPSPDYLCFTAKHAGAQVRIIKTGNPTPVTLETSSDKITWSTYTFGTVITLSNLGDKLYWRNTSETTTGFSTGTSNYYRFFISQGAVGIDGDVTTLVNKNGTDTLVGNYCFYNLFYYSDYITSAPRLPATTLTDYCYYYMFANTKIINTPSLPATTLANNCYMFMFQNCTELTALPKLPALVLKNQCYNNMFNGCSKIMLYNNPYQETPNIYRIPAEGSGTDSSNTLINMFANTGGYFTWTPYINTNYYFSNDIV